MWINLLMDDTTCKEQLRLDRRYFDKLCVILLQSKGGLVTLRDVTIKEIVARFLHYLGHNLKNRTLKDTFVHFGETIGHQFYIVLQAILKISKDYIKQVDPTTSYRRDNKWKWFEGALGTLDGTHIRMTVPLEDRPRYRHRKGDISTNVLVACDPNFRFKYVLFNWEGSASDPYILRNALRRPNGLEVPSNKYFLVDLRFTNG